MAEPPVPSELPEARVAAGKWRWAFLIWIVPLTAVLVGAWLAAKALLNQGPTIEIRFSTASGLEAGKTSVRYKDVEIGTVQAITLAEDRKGVVVTASMRRNAKPLLVEDTRFWVVRPRITGGQAFGLGTLISGAYIALDPGQSKVERDAFVGLETPPVVTSGAPGRQFVLKADDLGSVDAGSPVYFRRVRVGQAVSAELDRDGQGVTFRVFVDAPYDRYVTENTRFWNASGIDMSLGAGGFKLEAQSLQSIAIGGVAFQTPPDMAPGAPAEAERVFALYRDRDSALKHTATVRDAYLLRFDQSVRGLAAGSPVDFRGVAIGEVARITLDNTEGPERMRAAVEINVYPERMAAQFRAPPPAGQRGTEARILERLVARGLRAQLRTGNYITGQLYVTLDFFPSAKPAKLSAGTPREIPTVAGGFEDLQASLQGLLNKLEAIPYQELVADTRASMATLQEGVRAVQESLKEANALVRRVDTEIAPELKAALAQTRATLERAQAVLSDDAPLHGDLRTTLRDVTRAAEAIRGLADYLERHPESLLRGRREESQP